MESNNPNNTNQTNIPLENEGSTARSWVIVLAIAVVFLVWGLFIFSVVGVSWPPPWRYGTVPDVPGQSVYSVSQAEERAATAPLEGEKIRQQHVMGNNKGIEKPQGKGGL